jgi:hypothetical protein
MKKKKEDGEHQRSIVSEVVVTISPGKKPCHVEELGSSSSSGKISW